jgi:hypothetical protein
MSLGDYIVWCPCHRRIKTTEQKDKGLPCDICQQEQHAQEFPKRFEELAKEDR